MNSTISVWKDVLGRARASPGFTDTTRRRCHELTDCVLVFSDVESTTDPLVEVRRLGWYYPSEEELRSIVLGEGTQHVYTFTQQIKSQLPRIIAMLRAQPETRRALLQLVRYDELTLDEPYTPCLISSQFRMRDGKLHLSIHARSVDLLIGLPANLFQARVLAQHVASELGVVAGSISFLINSAHVFEDYEEELQRVMQKA